MFSCFSFTCAMAQLVIASLILYDLNEGKGYPFAQELCNSLFSNYCK